MSFSDEEYGTDVEIPEAVEDDYDPYDNDNLSDAEEYDEESEIDDDIEKNNESDADDKSTQDSKTDDEDYEVDSNYQDDLDGYVSSEVEDSEGEDDHAHQHHVDKHGVYQRNADGHGVDKHGVYQRNADQRNADGHSIDKQKDTKKDYIAEQIKKVKSEYINKNSMRLEKKVIMVPDHARKSSHYLSLSELTEIIGIRATQIEQGFAAFCSTNNESDPINLAIIELLENNNPMIVMRTVKETPMYKLVEKWKVREMTIDLSSYSYVETKFLSIEKLLLGVRPAVITGGADNQPESFNANSVKYLPPLVYWYSNTSINNQHFIKDFTFTLTYSEIKGLIAKLNMVSANVINDYLDKSEKYVITNKYLNAVNFLGEFAFVKNSFTVTITDINNDSYMFLNILQILNFAYSELMVSADYNNHTITIYVNNYKNNIPDIYLNIIRVKLPMLPESKSIFSKHHIRL